MLHKVQEASLLTLFEINLDGEVAVLNRCQNEVMGYRGDTDLGL